MNEKRHTVIDLKTGKRLPATSTAPLLSSAGAPWKGLLLEQHGDAEVDSGEIALPYHTVFLQHGRPTRLELKEAGARTRIVRRASGQVAVVPARTPFSVRTKGRGDLVVVTLASELFLASAHDLTTGGRVELVQRDELDDALLRASLLALHGEVAAGYPGGRLYGEQVAAAICAHLARHYSARRPLRAAAGGDLSDARLRRTVEFIHANLIDDVSLETLADVAGMTPFHFARLFKRATGQAPHRFVIQRRLERVREMLISSDATLAEIAAQTGFYDPSHLTWHFKRTWGVSPREFSRRVKSRKRGP
jgi:AraC family transcriptional regulator